MFHRTSQITAGQEGAHPLHKHLPGTALVVLPAFDSAGIDTEQPGQILLPKAQELSANTDLLAQIFELHVEGNVPEELDDLWHISKRRISLIPFPATVRTDCGLELCGNIFLVHF